MSFVLLNPLPKHCIVAVSGGPDSMAGLHWLSRSPSRVLHALHVNHGTGEFADASEKLVVDYCKKNDIPVRVLKILDLPPKGESKENFWRKKRYEIFDGFSDCYEWPIVTCHTLDDCIEEYVIKTMVRFSSDPQKLIAYHGPSNTIRPFRMWRKVDILDYCMRNDVPFLHDPTNFDGSNLRSSLRKSIIPELLRISPGLPGFVMKLLVGQETNS